jgi:hypothetical protein
MPGLMASERSLEDSRVGEALSWRVLTAAVRRQARTQPDQAAELLEFADLLEAFAELEDPA